MAINGAEVEVIGPGIVEDLAQNKSYVQNMYFHNGSWRVRRGFGTVGEFDPSLSRYTGLVRSNAEGEGFTEHLGSTVIKTNFGHTQIVSVVEQLTWLNNGDGNDVRKRLFSVHIYDVTTDDHWEELLIEPTGMTNVPLPLVRGHYEGFGKAIAVTDQHTVKLDFVEFNDIVYFASEDFGVWYYKPAAFRGNRGKAIELWRQKRYSDNTLIKPLIYVPNQSFVAEYGYFPSLPEPVVSISVLANRLVFLGKHTLFFSDPNRAQSIIVDNIINIPSEAPLTAAKEINGSLMVFSESETFLFQPGSGLIVSGRLTKISESIGCDSSSLVTKFDNKLVFVDRNGVHINAGGLEISMISMPINDFFTGVLSNPLNRYLVDNGDVSTTAKQPSLTSRYYKDQASIIYWEEFKLILLTVKDNGRYTTMCYSVENGQWSEWKWESAAYNEANVAKVGIRDNQKTHALATDGVGLWSVGIDETNQMTDNAQVWNGAAWLLSPNQNQKFRTLVIGEYGRGGAIDRSSEYEDFRYGIGEWEEPYDSTGAGFIGNNQGQGPELYFGPPLQVKPGFVLDGQTWNRGGALVPVYYKWDATVIPTNAFIYPSIYHWRLQFQFDAINWDLQSTSAGGFDRVNGIFVEGLENLRSGYGFGSLGFVQIAGLNEMQETGTNQVDISWDAHVAATATPAYNTFPSLYHNVNNAVANNASPLPRSSDVQVLFWLPFLKRTSDSTSNLNIVNINAAFYDNKFAAGAPAGANTFYTTRNQVFRFSSLIGDRNVDDAKAQGVDWCYLSPPLEPNEQKQSKVRGLFTKLSSTGTATNQIANSWGSATYAPRVFNTSVSSDYRRWGTQIIDYTGDPAGVSESDLAKVQPSIRTRVKNTATDMGYKVFEDANNQWDNNVLADDKQYGVLSTSNTTKGQFFTWLMWGHMLNKAESIVISGAKAVARIMGSRRRRGH
jgi:hypothetical protein